MSGYVCCHDRATLGLRVDYSDEALPLLRSLPEGRWNSESKLWLCSSAPGCLEVALEIAARLGLELYSDVLELVERRKESERQITHSSVLQARKRAHALGLALKFRQDEGIAFLANRDCALLAAKPGTGKTMMALNALPRSEPRVLVVAPTSAKYVWEEQAATWRPDLRPVLVKKSGKFRMPAPGEMVVVTYGMLPKAERKGRFWGLPEGVNVPAGLALILDEAHKVKTPTANRTRNARALIRQTHLAKGRIWGMTGTPVQNRPSELWSLLYSLLLAEKTFGSWPQFCSLFEQVDDGWGHMSLGDAKPELRDRLDRVMLQIPLRIGVEAPSKEYLSLDISLSAAEQSEGRALFESWRDAAGTEGEPVAWGSLAQHRRLLADRKLEVLGDYLDDLEAAEEPVVAFSSHREPVRVLGARKGWTWIDGEVPDSQRRDRVAEFQSGKVPHGIALTFRAGSEAVTLTRSRTVLLVDCDYNPTIVTQAIARCHRTGQVRQVRVIYVVAKNSVDRDVLAILDEKQRLIDATETHAPADPA